MYDLRERVHPEWASLPLPELGEMRRALVEKAVTALGVTQARWLHNYFQMKPRCKDADLAPLVEEGVLIRVAVEGWDAPGYVHSHHATLAQKAARGKLEATHRTLLSPFDPVLWDRERALGMFDFDYRLECFTPEPKRQFGYFSLPVLSRGALVGRLDAKAHRTLGVFEVKALFLERGVRRDEALAADLAYSISRCAAWHGTPRVKIVRTEPAGMARALNAALAKAGELSLGDQ